MRRPSILSGEALRSTNRAAKNHLGKLGELAGLVAEGRDTSHLHLPTYRPSPDTKKERTFESKIKEAVRNNYNNWNKHDKQKLRFRYTAWDDDNDDMILRERMMAVPRSVAHLVKQFRRTEGAPQVKGIDPSRFSRPAPSSAAARRLGVARDTDTYPSEPDRTDQSSLADEPGGRACASSCSLQAIPSPWREEEDRPPLMSLKATASSAGESARSDKEKVVYMPSGHRRFEGPPPARPSLEGSSSAGKPSRDRPVKLPP